MSAARGNCLRLLRMSRVGLLCLAFIGFPLSAQVSVEDGSAALLDQRGALADLAATVECRADEAARVRTHILLQTVLRQHQKLPPGLGKWRVKQDAKGVAVIELPKRMKVFGVSSREVVLDGYEKRATLARVDLQRLLGVQQLQGQAISPARQRDEWGRVAYVRNLANGNALRAELKVVRDQLRGAEISIGCTYSNVQRSNWVSEDHRISVDDAANEQAALELLPRLLACSADLQERNWLNTQLRHHPRRTTSGLGAWRRKEDRLGNQWWELPAEIDVGGLKVRRLYYRDRNFYVIHMRDSAGQLADRLGLSAAERDDGQPSYMRLYPQVQAADGWLEQKRLVVTDMHMGLSEQGCYFMEELAEMPASVADSPRYQYPALASR